MELVVVERHLSEPRSYEEIEACERQASSCLELYQIRHLRSYFSRDRTRLICLYEAPDAEVVREANRKGGMPFDSVWTADVFQPARAPR